MNKTTRGVRRILNEAISIRNELLSRQASKDDFLELIMLELVIYPTLDDAVKKKSTTQEPVLEMEVPRGDMISNGPEMAHTRE